MRLFFLFIALGLPTFAQKPGPDLRNSPDATTRLLIDIFKGDANRDGRITKGEFNWPKVLFSSIDQNKDGYITANEIESLLSPARTSRSSGSTRFNPSAPRQGRNTMRLDQKQLAIHSKGLLYRLPLLEFHLNLDEQNLFQNLQLLLLFLFH